MKAITCTNWYVEVWRGERYHLTFSVTQFAFGLCVLAADEGGWLAICGPFILSPLERTDS